MKICKLLSLIICIQILLSCTTTSTALGSPYEEAEKLFETMMLPEQYDQMIEKSLELQIKGNPSLLQYKEVMNEFMKKYMSYESIKDELILIYTSEFTAQELREINRFFSTSTGKKYSSLSPILYEKGGEIGLRKVQENIHELHRMIEQE